MKLNELARLADDLPEIREVFHALTAQNVQGAVEMEGLLGPAKSLVLARLYTRLQRPLLVVTFQHEQAQRMADDLANLGVPADRICLLPSTNRLFLEGDITDFRALGERIGALITLADGNPCIVLGTAEAVLQRSSPPADLTPYVFSIQAGESIELDSTITRLAEMGYETAATVSRPGQFSRRGGILDVFPSIAEMPVRIELFGEEVETIRPFDVTTQRSVARHTHVELAPAREIRLTPARAARAMAAIRKEFAVRKAALLSQNTRESREALARLTERVEGDLTPLSQGAYFDGMELYFSCFVPEEMCAFDYLPRSGVVVLDEPNQVREHWLRFTTDIQCARERRAERGETLDASLNTCAFEPAVRRLAERPTLLFSLLGRRPEGVAISRRVPIHSGLLSSYRGRLAALADEIGVWLANSCRVVLVSDQPHRVREICAELNLPVQPREAPLGTGPGLFVTEGHLRSGFTVTDLRLYVLTDAELFGSARPVVARKRVAAGTAISSVLDLREKDFVVHIHHGIGIYRGLVKRKVDSTERDYLLIEYQGGDRLFVPADQIDRVQRYNGGDGAPPVVHKIGGADWQRTTRRVREQAREIAGELIRLYAAREAATRPTFGQETSWQIEMEEAFPYQETPDQLKAIRDVKSDLDRDKPMDRLICGDVGFGKTEVALRAAFKVVTGGKQVAVLCPTTILAAQHHSTFSARLAAYPIRVELLSRFRSRAEQMKTVQGLKDGSIDIVVATHRVLGKDVAFRNLGLVIVDEEQRFGVAHKERLKQLRTSVDVLTLTATPIPRTLSMALSGLRDMSVIEDPPEGRAPVLTYVREYDDDLIRDAILREMERDGQVYFVHNRVESILHVAEHLRRLVPDARIEIGHGQMSEEELERVMFDFYGHNFDILVCTTIVENGLDIPNVNTILIDSSDHMGLSQLYQLRGRVGRSNRQAYCYLFYRQNKQLSEVAERRLAAIKEFTALGSGHKVAMRDLEIRGAGNLLGAEQHGALLSVGFDLYCQLLAQAVQELRGEEVTEDILPPVDLPITAYIPDEYIPGEAERIYFYKRMSGVRSTRDIDDLQAELEDRFGDPPRPVWDALAVLRLRLKCQEIGVSGIRTEGAQAAIRFAPHARLSAQAVQLLTAVFKGHRFTPEGVTIPMKGPGVMAQIEEIVSVLEQALKSGRNGVASNGVSSSPLSAGARSRTVSGR